MDKICAWTKKNKRRNATFENGDVKDARSLERKIVTHRIICAYACDDIFNPTNIDVHVFVGKTDSLPDKAYII